MIWDATLEQKFPTGNSCLDSTQITEWDLEHSKENSRRTNNTNDPAKRASMLSIWINDEKLIKLMLIK